MPRSGDHFLGFELVEELGRGSFARVFLAKQEALAGRAVALKVTLRPTREAERLARLQHTNVVPIYSIHNALPVQVICMPYLGRQTIADLLEIHRRGQSQAGLSTRHAGGQRKGSTTVTGSRTGPKSGQPCKVDAQPPAAPVRNGPSLIGDPLAVLQVLSQLADGLVHAHARGILHLDLKPGNVLLADTGEPMLLDFNLSFDTTEASRELVGGTVPYMAPEQLIDLKSRGNGGVDARTDLYSLGVMAFEMLAGKTPFPNPPRFLTDYDGLIAARQKGPPPLRDLNPAVTPAFESIVRKLLAPNPEDRYQSAANLKEDLERQLHDRPLKYAPDRSLPERARKWRRRNPRALTAVGMAIILTIASTAGAMAFRSSEAQADARAAEQARRTQQVLKTSQLDLILPDEFVGRDRASRRVNEVLAEYGIPNDPNWREQPAFLRVGTVERTALAADLGELVLLLVHARRDEWKAPDLSKRRAVAEEMLGLNRVAEECFQGTSIPPFLVQQREELAAAAGVPFASIPIGQPMTARDHFLEAAALIANGRYSTAIPSLERVVADRPGHAAAQFCLAYCRQQVGQYARAVERYQTARVLMPTDPRPLFQSGVVYGLLGRYAAADEQFTKALALDRFHGEAYRNRGLARIRLGQYRKAERDLSEALALPTSRLQVYLLRAEARAALGDTAGSEKDKKSAAKYRPEREFDYLVRGVMRQSKDPLGALADYQAAEAVNPLSLTALNNQARLLASVFHDDRGALAILSRLVDLFPEHPSAHGDRAILLARLGRRDEAHRAAEVARTLSDDVESAFRRACVYALTSASHPGDRAQALALLRQACRWGFRDMKSLESNSDLASLRGLPEFAAILNAVRELSQ